MALNIEDPDADRIVRELAAATGESITVAVTTAAAERLERLQGASPREQKRAAIQRIQARVASRSGRSNLSEDQILDYDQHGIPR